MFAPCYIWTADLRAPNKCGTCVAVHTPLIDVLGRDVPPLVRQDQVGDGPPVLWEHDPTELVQFPFPPNKLSKKAYKCLAIEH